MGMLREGAHTQRHPNAPPVRSLQGQRMEAVQHSIHQQRLGLWRFQMGPQSLIFAHAGRVWMRAVGPGRAHCAQAELCRAALGVLCTSTGWSLEPQQLV